MLRNCRIYILAFILSFCLCSVAIGAVTSTVLFDESHGQQFLSGSEDSLGLSGLAGLLKERGFTLRASKEELTKETLTDVDLLIVSGPFLPFSDAEIKALTAYLEGGGGLLLLLHVAPPVRDLLHHLDVDFSNGTLREAHHAIDGNPLDFKVNVLADHPVTNGLDGFSVYGAWALRSTAEHVSILAQTSPQAWIDLNRDGRLSNGDAFQSFGVLAVGAIGQGRYAVIGDDAVFQNRFLDEDNRALAAKLSNWVARK